MKIHLLWVDSTVTQPGCNSEETGSIELEMSGGVNPTI